jgi:hypothetical protein
LWQNHGENVIALNMLYGMSINMVTIADCFMPINLLVVKDTMRKLILLDILNILAMIRKYQTSDEIEKYIVDALNVGILHKRAKKSRLSLSYVTTCP